MSKQWDPGAIRAHLEQKCRRQLGESLWEVLIELKWIDDVVSGEMTMEWLVDKVCRMQAPDSGTPPNLFRKHTREEVKPRPSISRSEQAEAMAEYLGALATEEPRVRIFRREVIGGIRRNRTGRSRVLTMPDGTHPSREAVMAAERAVLKDEDAWNLLESSAATVMSPEQFATAGIEIVGHQTQGFAKEVGVDTGETHYLMRFVNAESHAVEQVVAPADQELTEIAVPARGGGTVARSVHRDSVLGELGDTSRSLNASLPWSEPASAWFVLTGEVPHRAPVEAGFEAEAGLRYPYTTGRITLSVDAAVPPKEVEAQYSQIRRRLIPGRVRSDPKTLAVFRFVNQSRLRRPGHTWRELVRDWDANCSRKDWTFNGDAKRFRKYWERGIKAAIPDIKVDAAESDEATVRVRQV